MQRNQLAAPERLPCRLDLRGEAERNGLELGAEPREHAGRFVERVRDGGIELDEMQVGTEREAQTADAGVEARGEVGDRNVGGGRIVTVIARHRAQQQSGVARRARHRPGVIEAERVRVDPAETDATVGRLEPDYPAVRGRAPDRSAGVAAGRTRTEECGDGGARSAARSTGHAVERPRIARRSVPRIVRRRAGGELVRVALADEDGARFLETAHAVRVFGRHVVPVERRPVRRANAGGVEDVLDPDRHAVERAAPASGLQLSFGAACRRTRLGRHHGDERVQRRIEAIDAREVRVGHFHRGDGARAHEARELRDREVAELLVDEHQITPRFARSAIWSVVYPRPVRTSALS